MNFTELIVNFRAEIAKISGILKKLQEQLNEIEAFAEEQGLLEKHSQQPKPKRRQ